VINYIFHDEGVYCLTAQQEKVYKRLYMACSELNMMAYEDYIKAGETKETQPFKPHELTVKIIDTMDKVMRGELDPNDGLGILREDDIKSELQKAKERKNVSVDLGKNQNVEISKKDGTE
jgi:hypothetical protein